jgi:GABA permease
MAWTDSFLVVANVTAESAELREVLMLRARRRPSTFMLIVPASHDGVTAAAANLDRALATLRDAGLTIEGQVGDADPLVAVSEAWNPRSFDEIIVATLPTGLSRWLHAGLPERIGKLTGAPVTHVVAEPPKPHPALHSVPAPPRERHGVMSALEPLEWGAPRAQAR